MGSLEIEEGGPTGGNIFNEDTLEDVCLCNVDHEVVRYQDFVNLFMEKSGEMCLGFEVGHFMVSVPAHFDHYQRQTIKDAGAISGLNVCRVNSEFEPTTKPRGIPESSTRAKLSPQDESQGTSKSDPELMLRSAFWILQMAYLLLQSGPQAKATEEAKAKEAEEKAAKKRATRVSVSCQAALDEDEKRATRVSISCQTAFDKEEEELE